MADHAARRGRRDVPDAAPERHRRARRQNRPRLLDLPVRRSPMTRPFAAVRTIAAWRFSATRCSWGRSTRTWSRINAKNGRHLWETRVADHRTRLLPDYRPARRERQSHRRHRRRRERDPRIHRGLRGDDRQGSLAVQCDPGPLASPATKRGGAIVEERRRLALGDRLRRCRLEPDVLGNRESGARLESGINAPATTSIPARRSRSMPIRASSSGTSSSHRTTAWTDSAQVPVLVDMTWAAHRGS